MKKTDFQFNISFLLLLIFTVCGVDASQLTAVGITTCNNQMGEIIQQEEIFLHIDRVKYIAGEDIWFSVYTVQGETGKLSANSAIAYVELLNPWNIPVIQSRFQLSGGRGEGDFLLPDSISSGTYTIRAYTNWMKNFLPGNCFIQDIEIYNPFKETDFFRKVDSVSKSDFRPMNSPSQSEGNICLVADTLFGRREKVFVRVLTGNNIDGRSEISEISISVAPHEIISLTPWKNGPKVGNKSPAQYRFETDGHYLSVTIRFRDETISDPPDFLYMSIQGKIAEFNYANRDTSGCFIFILPVDGISRNLILQPEHANNNMILEIEPSFPGLLPASNIIRETFSESRHDLFSGLSFNYQASRIYGISLKKEALADDSSGLRKRRFYGIPEMEVFLDDYIKLPTIQEVFFELVPGVIIRSGKTGFEIKITNPLTGDFYIEPPLVMIDGVIINDLAVLVDLDPDLVEKIEVVKTPYLIGDLILPGIVNVITRSGDFSDITMPDYAVLLPYRVVESPSVFTAPDYSDEQNRLSRKPDLRNTLYWNPAVKTGVNGEAEIEFWTSDLPDTYVISVRGISADGKKISINKTFTVR